MKIRNRIQRHRLAVVAGTVMLVAGTQTIVAPVTDATVTTCTLTQSSPTRTHYAGNYFDGMARFGDASYIGDLAYILVHTHNLCPSDQTTYNPTTQDLGNFGYAWTMIADNSSTSNYWLQSGYFHSYGIGEYNFAQLNANGTITDHKGAQVTPGDTHKYWQQYHPDSYGVFHSNVDTTRLLNTQTNIEANWSGVSLQFENEERYVSSDVPGSATAKVSFTGILVQRANGTFVGPPNPFLAGNNDCTLRWGGPDPTSTAAFQVWTQSPAGEKCTN